MNVEHILHLVPEAALKQALEAVDAIRHFFAARKRSRLLKDSFVKEAEAVFFLSEFAASVARSRPEIILDLLESGDLFKSYSRQSYTNNASRALKDCADVNEAARALRVYRNREMVRIAWRDLSKQAPLIETLLDLTHLAESCLDEGLKRLYSFQAEKMGHPLSSDRRRLQLVVLGMGKLGGRELNFSSDVDLVLCYEEDGHTEQGHGYTNNQFFTSLAQSLLKLIGTGTEDGFVFRTDTRLRPFGDQGPLVASFDAMEEYYEVHGREWERYALIKARPVAGDIDAGNRLLKRLRPFVYRKYLDFSALESLRGMKLLIEKEHGERALKDNLKLGPGGIRDIEFICQALQLLHGGRFPELQVQGTIDALNTLEELGLYPRDEIKILKESYYFLRTAENHIQEIRDSQTHAIPKSDLDRLRLALAFGCRDWPSFEQMLQHKMGAVSSQFKAFLSASADEGAEIEITFAGQVKKEELLPILEDWGFKDPTAALNMITGFWTSRSTRSLGPMASQRLQHLFPRIVKEASRMEEPEQTLSRMLDILDAIKGRAVYLSLLLENQAALKNLVFLSSKCEWIARHVARYPVVLDELIDPRLLFAPDSKEALEKSLCTIMGRIAEDDLESQMEELRRFRHGAVLRVAAADITGALSVLEVGKLLSDIAEVILNKVVQMAFSHVVKRHGMPKAGNGPGKVTGFLVAGYGKLGSREMGYGSDLDLVFLHSGQNNTMTTGPKKIHTPLFYARLGQRILHILTAYTPYGRLYEVDMRLRPEGESGVLVSSLASFFQYQMDMAWTWEHQALVRARPICGDSVLKQEFIDLRKKILCQKRNIKELRQKILDMREKIGAEKDKNRLEMDIKYKDGGLVDIEFITQFLVLAHASEAPALCDHTGTIPLLGALNGFSYLEEEQAACLIKGFQLYLKAINEKRLTGRITGQTEHDCRRMFEKVIQVRRKVLNY